MQFHLVQNLCHLGWHNKEFRSVEKPAADMDILQVTDQFSAGM
jgi:hypothetical protein